MKKSAIIVQGNTDLQRSDDAFFSDLSEHERKYALHRVLRSHYPHRDKHLRDRRRRFLLVVPFRQNRERFMLPYAALLGFLIYIQAAGGLPFSSRGGVIAFTVVIALVAASLVLIYLSSLYEFRAAESEEWELSKRIEELSDNSIEKLEA